MRPLVILDIDDVLCLGDTYTGSTVILAFQRGTLDADPAMWEKVFHFGARKNLRALHDEFEPEYVIGSSWADSLDREQIGELLLRTDLQFVRVGLHERWCTPRWEESTRAAEILAWFDEQENEERPPFVIIDDLVSGLTLKGSSLEGNTIFCEAWKGFVHPKLRSARRILQEQIAKQK